MVAKLNPTHALQGVKLNLVLVQVFGDLLPWRSGGRRRGAAEEGAADGGENDGGSGEGAVEERAADARGEAARLAGLPATSFFG